MPAAGGRACACTSRRVSIAALHHVAASSRGLESPFATIVPCRIAAATHTHTRMLLDTVLYLLLAYYVDSVAPGNGPRKPWDFFLRGAMSRARNSARPASPQRGQGLDGGTEALQDPPGPIAVSIKGAVKVRSTDRHQLIGVTHCPTDAWQLPSRSLFRPPNRLHLPCVSAVLTFAFLRHCPRRSNSAAGPRQRQ